MPELGAWNTARDYSLYRTEIAVEPIERPLDRHPKVGRDVAVASIPEDLQFVLPVAPTITAKYIRSFTERCPVPVRLSEGKVYDVLRASDAAIVVSGTATLETGLMGVPMVIIYRVSRLTAFLVKMLATYDHVGLVNIVADRRIVPELVQEEVTAGNISTALSAILSDHARTRTMKEDLAAVRSRLGDSGASRKAAEIVLRQLGGTL